MNGRYYTTWVQLLGKSPNKSMIILSTIRSELTGLNRVKFFHASDNSSMIIAIVWIFPIGEVGSKKGRVNSAMQLWLAVHNIYTVDGEIFIVKKSSPVA